MCVFPNYIYTTWKYPNIHFLKSDVAISLPKLPTMDPPIRSKAYLDRSKRSAPWYSSKRLDTIWCQWKLSINPFCQQLKNKKHDPSSPFANLFYILDVWQICWGRNFDFWKGPSCSSQWWPDAKKDPAEWLHCTASSWRIEPKILQFAPFMNDGCTESIRYR